MPPVLYYMEATMIGSVIGHYEIVEKLGEGGMGVVFKARDTSLNRFVAIKLLPAGKAGDENRIRRFTQEARTASALNHPNIVTIHEISSHNGAPFIVMEFVPGKALDRLIPRNGMRLNEVFKIGTQIASALAAAAAPAPRPQPRQNRPPFRRRAQRPGLRARAHRHRPHHLHAPLPRRRNYPAHQIRKVPMRTSHLLFLTVAALTAATFARAAAAQPEP